MSEDWMPADYYEAVQIGWPMSDHSINLTDVTRQPHPDPCPDCGQEHMNGEHISLTVPASDGGTRTVWEGCADCWAKRTDPKNVTTEARDAAVRADERAQYKESLLNPTEGEK